MGALWELPGSSLGALWELVAVAGIVVWRKLSLVHLQQIIKNATRMALTTNIGMVATDPLVRRTECNVGLRKFS
jgi:hypothetical protein